MAHHPVEGAVVLSCCPKGGWVGCIYYPQVMGESLVIENWRICLINF